MNENKELVPITREYLKEFYKSYPIKDIPEDLILLKKKN